MSTSPRRLHLSANATDTAVLISESKAMPPHWAAITRGSAAEVIESHSARHDRLQPLTRADTWILAPLTVLALGAAVVFYLNNLTVIAWGIPLVAFGIFVLSRLPKPLPPELDRQIIALTNEEAVLTACPLPIALELTEAQHSALRVAEDYDVIDEVLGALIERHQAQIDADQTRRRELAEEIVNDHATEGSRHTENAGS